MLNSPPNSQPPTKQTKNRKSLVAKQFVIWHWISSAICLFAMLFFAITGITLNHAASLSAKADIITKRCTLPPVLLDLVTAGAVNLPQQSQKDQQTSAIPKEIGRWIRGEIGVRIPNRPAEWDDSEIYISLPRPGGDAWLTIDRSSGEVQYEMTSQGVVAYLNDLHKGRNTGTQWAWFIDVFSIASILFCVTGLGLLWVHAKRRPTTWPVVAAGALIPILIIVFFVH